MSRTVREVRVIGRKAEKVKEHISLWFSANHFDVKEWASKGKRLWVYTWFTFPGFLLSPHIGSIVAVRIEPYGCVVFEIILKEERNDTLVHGEFYTTGSTIMMGRERDVRASSPTLGKFARQEGYDAMIRFLESLEGLSVKPES